LPVAFRRDTYANPRQVLSSTSAPAARSNASCSAAFAKKREANVHLSQFIGPEATEANLTARIDLCEECAKEHGVNGPVGFSLADLLTKVKKLNRK
jgi:hypothetical protein